MKTTSYFVDIGLLNDFNVCPKCGKCCFISIYEADEFDEYGHNDSGVVGVECFSCKTRFIFR